jgi:hypothetical protein
MGIQVFYPLSKFRVKGPIKVGSIFEWLILAGLVAGIVKMML